MSETRSCALLVHTPDMATTAELMDCQHCCCCCCCEQLWQRTPAAAAAAAAAELIEPACCRCMLLQPSAAHEPLRPFRPAAASSLVSSARRSPLSSLLTACSLADELDEDDAADADQGVTEPALTAALPYDGHPPLLSRQRAGATTLQLATEPARTTGGAERGRSATRCCTRRRAGDRAIGSAARVGCQLTRNRR